MCIYIQLHSGYLWIYPPCILYVYPTKFRLLMDIPSVYSVFISNYIQTTDVYTLRVLCIYIQLYSDYWWIYTPFILYLYPTKFRLLIDIPSVYSVFISNYIQTTDGYTLRVFWIYIQLYSDYWWIFPLFILYLYPTIFRLLMDIPSVYSVFIQTTDGYTLRVLYSYIKLYSDYWWIYPPCILYWIH